MKQVTEQLIKIANQLDEKGQEIGFDPMAPGSAQDFDPKLNQLSKDIGNMFQMPERDSKLDLQTFLHTVASINLRNKTNEGVIIGNGLAAHLVEEANRLLKTI
jgi:hypothetical protein